MRGLDLDATLVGGLGAVAVVVVVAMLARLANTPQETGTTETEGALSEGAVPAPDALDESGFEEDDDGADDETGGSVIAITSDNYAVVPTRHAVYLMPPDESGEAWKPGAAHRRGERALAMRWHAGDLTGARVVRGAADEGPWRFEALGRDGEYIAFVFETREGADAALALFQSRHVVKLGQDETGADAPPSPEQFEEARRVFLETEAELANEEPLEDDERKDPLG